MVYNVLKLPVFAVVCLALLMLALNTLGFVFAFVLPFRLEGSVVLAVIGTVIILIAALQFKLKQTTVNPLKPEQTSSLVSTGLFSVSRNPMYIGFLLWLLACAMYSQNALNYFVAVSFIVVSNKFYIQPEEAALEALFGSAFSDYKKRVPRWLVV